MATIEQKPALLIRRLNG